MKNKLYLDKIRTILSFLGRFWQPLVLTVVIIVFLILTAVVITPKEDAAVRADGDARVQSLDIQFNKRLLNDLAGTTQPTSVTENGGRDPFSPF